MKNVFFAFISLILFSACEPNVYFEDPQPNDGKVEKKFNKKLIGKYKNSSVEGSFLEITKDKIITEYFWQEEYTKDGLDTIPDYKWKNGTLYYLNQPQKITQKGDTIFIHQYSKEIEFAISETDILKSYKKMYFTNQQYEQGWYVKKLILDSKKNLIISKISSDEEMTQLEQITTVETVMDNDTSSAVDYYKIKPTDEEFNDILNGNFFTVDGIYIRIK